MIDFLIRLNFFMYKNNANNVHNAPYCLTFTVMLDFTGKSAVIIRGVFTNTTIH
jgi:hypothetical protein